MDKDTIHLALMEYLNPLKQKFLQNLIHQHRLDRYVKKFNCLIATQLLTFAQLMQVQSYTDISLQLNTKKKLQQILGLSSISTAQLSRKWRDMDYAFLEQVYQHMVQCVISKYGLAKANKQLQCINLVDASTIILCLNRYRWAPYSKHKGAVKLHLRYIDTGETGYPDKVILTTGKVGDRKCMEELVVHEPDALNVFDRGYVDYRLFDQFCEKSIRFVTRLRHNADYKVMEERSIEPGSAVIQDAVIWLGHQGTRYVMKKHLRLIVCLDKDGAPMLLCTNDFDLSAEELGDIYRRRWQIELFFKWMKQHFHVKRCYGTSRNAVYNQILTALIAFCLGLLMKAKVQYKGTLLTLMKQVRLGWDESMERLLQLLFSPPKRTSKGRRRQRDTERIFVETYRQYVEGEADHLDTMEYEARLE